MMHPLWIVAFFALFWFGLDLVLSGWGVRGAERFLGETGGAALLTLAFVRLGRR